MEGILYPDNGAGFEDVSVLRNAVYFATAERAYSAELVLTPPLSVNQQTTNFLVVRAFEEFMTSTEDLIGWLYTLKEWQPGNAQNSLFILLDRIQVGRGQYEETKAVTLLSNLNSEGFRTLFHIPKDEELIASGMTQQLVEKIEGSIPSKLGGWLKMAKTRAEQDRGMVGMFNKVKHHMLAFPTRERGKHEVLIPYNIDMDKEPPAIHLGNGWLESSTNQIRRFAGDAIAAQAVLHDTLALILTTRYKEKYSPPTWLIKAYRTYF